MADISKEVAVQLAREAKLVSGTSRLSTYWIEGTDLTPYVLQFAQSIFKLGRNAGLEEAAQKCRTPHGYFKDARTNTECALAIESLKDNTP